MDCARGRASLGCQKKTGASIEEDEADTLSGYILGLKGTIPEDGTTFELETDSMLIKALQIKDHTVEKAELYIKLPADEEDEESDKDKEKEKDRDAAGKIAAGD